MKVKGFAALGLRVPFQLKKELQEAARKEGRSMNAQIVRHLREIYQPDTEEAQLWALREAEWKSLGGTNN